MAQFHSSKPNQRAFASLNDIHDVFHKHGDELEWLAYFITGNRAVAQRCVAEACTASESPNSVFAEWLLTWARHTTIRCAIDSQHDLIRQVSARYENNAVVQRREPLSEEWLQVFTHTSEIVAARLDVVSRSALVICGVQKNSIADAALILGVTRAVASAAYCAALDCLQTVCCEHLVRESNATMSN